MPEVWLEEEIVRDNNLYDNGKRQQYSSFPVVLIENTLY